MNTTRRRLIPVVASVLALAVVTIFALWWFRLSHISHNFSGSARVFDVLLFVGLSYVIWHPIIMEVLAWAVASHIKDLPPRKPQPGMRVAFITNFVPGSEPISLLKKTLPAMVGVDYRHDTWLLDEGDDPEVKKLCKKYGVLHNSRQGKPRYNTQGGKFAAKTKGGNHNAWYDIYGHDYDFVAQIDTDFIPTKNFLTKTLGYFIEPNVAFVGTPQIYGNINSCVVARGAAEQTYSFYGPFLRGMEGSLLIGANHAIRVAALESIGHYKAHITEDLLTGMSLHAAHWKSVYVPEALAIGEGPSTWKSFFNQQMRWAYGCMDILFHHSPGLLTKMPMRRSMYYFVLQQYYFGGVAMVLGILGSALYFFGGLNVANLETRSFVIVYIPVLLACLAMSLLLQRFNIRPNKEKGLMLAGKLVTTAALPTFFVAFVCVILRKHLVYKVTPKAEKRAIKHEFGVFVPHLIIVGLGVVEIASSFITHRQSAVMLFWTVSLTAIMVLLPFVENVYTVARRVKRYARSFVK
ncbi:MAG TPA: glycosyltransferase family 2 protein [Patescibacteria group bacterium]|nr:glycosyltransferase family 2 protein [Patescibacteria group bacterium]